MFKFNFNFMQKLISALVFIGLFANCQNNKQSTKTVGATLPPVETKAPNSPQYKPAFIGQTRVAAVKTFTPLDIKIISDILVKPWAVISLPDGRLLITEKSGTFRIASASGNLSAPITGAPSVDDKGQGGLLDVALDPDFVNNRIIYWTFSERIVGGTHTAVAKGRLASDEKTIEGAMVIYQALPTFEGSAHYGSRLLFDKKGNLFVSTGERQSLETRPKAQYLNTALGKVLHITKEGRAVAGNPFENTPDARPEIYSLGHRTPQGLDIHPLTGDLWECEMGPKGGDEVNLIKPGKNYGWPTITYGIEYNGKPVGEGITQKDGLEQPVYYWDPVVSCSGMSFYTSHLIPEWKNNLFIGGLSSKHIVRLVIKNNKVIGEERLLENEGQRIRDIGEGKDGALYAITDGGRLYRIAKK